jgi:hypothetical protein
MYDSVKVTWMESVQCKKYMGIGRDTVDSVSGEEKRGD